MSKDSNGPGHWYDGIVSALTPTPSPVGSPSENRKRRSQLKWTATVNGTSSSWTLKGSKTSATSFDFIAPIKLEDYGLIVSKFRTDHQDLTERLNEAIEKEGRFSTDVKKLGVFPAVNVIGADKVSNKDEILYDDDARLDGEFKPDTEVVFFSMIGPTKDKDGVDWLDASKDTIYIHTNVPKKITKEWVRETILATDEISLDPLNVYGGGDDKGPDVASPKWRKKAGKKAPETRNPECAGRG